MGDTWLSWFDWVRPDGPFGLPFPLWTVTFLLLGLIVGSFLNVVIHRLPLGLSTVTPPSHCPKCETRIRLRHNLPVLSWLLLRGRCAYCGAPISPRYVLVEAFTGVVFLVTWLSFGREQPLMALALCALFAGFIAATLIDLEHYIIPDQITVGGIFAGFLFSALAPGLHFVTAATDAMKRSGLGALVGGGLVYLVLRGGKLLFGRQRVELPPGSTVVFTEEFLQLPNQRLPYDDLFYRKSDTVVLEARRLELADRCYWNCPVRVALQQTPPLLQVGNEKFDASQEPWMSVETEKLSLPREAMGFGDVKFMAAIGAFLGWQATIFSLMASAVLGSLVGVGLILAGKRDWSARLPYGPFIAVAATLWVWGGHRWVVEWFTGR
jgi:leader peptidase (prepilin peptidase)/N-methyltransferase